MRYYPFKIEVDGHLVRSEWGWMQGGRICVRCQPYGKLIVPVGRRHPVDWAKRVTEIIVRCYYKRQEEEIRRQEREAIRLGGKRRRRSELVT